MTRVVLILTMLFPVCLAGQGSDPGASKAAGTVNSDIAMVAATDEAASARTDLSAPLVSDPDNRVASAVGEGSMVVRLAHD